MFLHLWKFSFPRHAWPSLTARQCVTAQKRWMMNYTLMTSKRLKHHHHRNEMLTWCCHHDDQDLSTSKTKKLLNQLLIDCISKKQRSLFLWRKEELCPCRWKLCWEPSLLPLEAAGQVLWTELNEAETCQKTPFQVFFLHAQHLRWYQVWRPSMKPWGGWSKIHFLIILSISY